MIQGGILASTSTGIVSDATWKCTSVLHDNWYSPDFDDSNWDPAYEIAENIDNGPFSVSAEIDPSAQWIWTPRWQFGDRNVYCRRKIEGTLIEHNIVFSREQLINFSFF